MCGKNYADEQAEKELLDEDLVIVAALNIPDFLVEVPAGREPVVLQLSDPQICNWGDLEKWCYSYIRETVQETKPDLIIMTGDVVYGRFDPDGTLLTSLIAFMETLKTPWAPVFGNHDNESLMGVDWQCDQLETAKYCLFKQGDLTGNGNYSVGLAQNDELLRVFYMMDSNGCGAPMCDSNGVQTKPAAGTNVVKTSAGFGKDQIDWYTDEITAIHEVDSDVKISFAYHIQQAIFGKAFAKYEEYTPSNVNGSILNNPLDLDKMETADETDFGYLGRTMKDPWDTNYTVFNGMKALGADSIFVGHEHCNSCSIVYEGVRFQFSQKSSMYDRYNSVTEDGTITGAYMEGHPADSHPLMGGTVIPVSSVDGSIGTGYIYYAGNPFYFEPKPVELPVNGLKLDSTMLQSGMGMTIHGTAFSETLNAYKIYSEGQGKLYFAPALAAEYNTFTFTALVPEDSANTTSVEFYLRVKDANGNNPLEESDGKYIYYGSSLIPRGQWKTFTVDITSVGEDCKEFSLMFSAGTTIWLRDIAFSTVKSGYRAYNVTAQGDGVVLGAGSIGGKGASIETGAGNGYVDQAYLALDGNYALNDYVVFDFTGKNMPEVAFFAKNYNNSMYAGGTSKQGIVVVTGITQWDGSTSWVNGNSTQINYGFPYMIQNTGDGGFCRDAFADSALGRANLVDGTHYRVIMGFTGSGNVITLHWCLYNLDTNTVVEQSSMSTWNFFTGSNAQVGNMTINDWSGSIVLYGKFGTTTTIDTLHGVKSGTFSDIVAEYTA